MKNRFTDVSEEGMVKLSKAAIENANYGKDLSQGAFANKLLSESLGLVTKAIQDLYENKKMTLVQNEMDSFLGKGFRNDKKAIESIAVSVIEFILGSLFLHTESESGRSPRYRHVTISKISKYLLKAKKDDPTGVKVSGVLFETSIEAMPFVEETHFIRGGKNVIYYSLSDDKAEELSSALSNIIHGAFYPLPITQPPVPWTFIESEDGKTILRGGYQNNKTSLIRSEKSNMPTEAYNPNFLKDTDALDAINLIQSVAFKINKGNLQRLKDFIEKPEKPTEAPEGYSEYYKLIEEWREDVEVAKNTMPLSMTPREKNAAALLECVRPTPKTEEDKEKFHLFNLSRAKYREMSGKYQTNLLMLEIAEMFKDEDRIYFPHNFDYRGRMYPIPVGLSPQGNDISKGLLEFADSVELTDEGVAETVMYLASVYGHDKEPREKRFELGMKLLQKEGIDFYEAEEPYVFAQVWELLQRVSKGDRTSNIAIAIDGSCNGLQHMSAITLDKKGGENVNVCGDKPRSDIYLIVAETSKNLIDGAIVKNIDEEMELLHLSSEWMDNSLEGSKARKIAKKPVMINPYGGSFDGYTTYVLDAIKEYYPKYGNRHVARKLTKFINKAMDTAIDGGTIYKKWASSNFAEVAKSVKSHKDGTIYFTTPDGFKVNNVKYKVKTKRIYINSLLGRGGRKTININTTTKKIDVHGIKTAIQPNIIHSLDATHLRMTALDLAKKGESQLWFIHDSFATNPNSIVELNVSTRESFVELYSEGESHPLSLIYRDIVDQIGYVPNYLKIFEGEDQMVLEDVLENESFFA